MNIIKRIFERLLPEPQPEWGRCLRCLRPYYEVEGHTTYFTAARGCFPLCKHCWGELSPEQRLPYYRRLHLVWTVSMHGGDPPGMTREQQWEAMEKAVLEGK